MPIKKSSSRLNNTQRFRFFWPLVILLVLIIALTAGYYLMQTPQDIRQQAAGSCAEAPVNVEFRKYTGKDEPGWKEGSKFSFKVGDKVDVNCFAKNGTALLSGGSFKVTLDGKSFTIPSSAKKSATEIRGWKIEKPGTYRFTCSNSSGCSNTDSIKVTGTTKASPSPSPKASPRVTPTPAANPTATPGTGTCNSVADLNKDCKVDLLDYDLFLVEFIKSQS